MYEKQAIPQAKQSSSIALPMKTALAGKDQTFASALDYRGVKVMAVSRYLGDVQLGLVVKVDLSEAQQPLQNVLITTIVVSIFSILLAIMIALVVSRSISEPLQQLSQAVQEISSKGIYGKVKLDNLDPGSELGVLTENFNDMSNKLGDLYKNLDKKVKEETKKFEKALAESDRLNKYMVGRELKMMELKKQIEELEKKR